MSGDEVYRRASEMNPEIEVLYITGYPREMLAQRLPGTPGTRILEKPFSAGDLARKVREVLDGTLERPSPTTAPE